MKSAMLLPLALGVSVFLFGPAEAQQPSKPVVLKCQSVNNSFFMTLKIQGNNLFLDDRLTDSKFNEVSITFINPSMPEYFHVLDRENGKLTVYNKDKTFDSAYNCRIVSSTMF